MGEAINISHDDDDLPVTTIVDLALDEHDDDDDEEAESHPRRLAAIGDDAWVVHGGVQGLVKQVQYNNNDSTVPTVSTVCQWDDEAVHAIATTSAGAGHEVAVGFDSGFLHVYEYPPPQATTTAAVTQQPHAFLKSNPPTATPARTLCFEATVRDVAFHPVHSAYLAVATETGFLVLDRNDTGMRHMESLSKQHHASRGVRGLAFGTVGGGSGNGVVVVLATLDMDGWVCLWDCRSASVTEWTLLQKEKVVTRPDVGEMLGADAFDRSCRPVFYESGDAGPTWLSLPGETHVQVRRLTLDGNDNTIHVTPLEVPTVDTGPVLGHVETIVTTVMRRKSLVTAGRDGRVVLWKIADNRVVFVRRLAQLQSAATDIQWMVDQDAEYLCMVCANGSLVTLAGMEHLAGAGGTKTTTSAEGKKTTTVAAPTVDAANDNDDDDDSLLGAFAATKDTSAMNDDNNDDDDDAPVASSTPAPKKNKAPDRSMDFLNEDDEDEALFSSLSPLSKLATDQTTASGALKASAKAILDDDDDDEDSVVASSSPPPKESREPTMTPMLDDDDDALFASTPSSPPASKNPFVEDEAADEDDDPTPANADKDVGDPVNHDLVDNDDGNDDDNREEQDSVMADSDVATLDGAARPLAFAGAALPRLPVVEAQPAFSPSSSPLDLVRRFLCWNHVGSVTLHQGETSRTTVDIRFTDAAFRRPITFTDTLGFIVGSLGDDGGIFATDLTEDDDDDEDDDDLGNLVGGLTKAALKKKKSGKPTGSNIYFHRFETFGALREKDWYLTLPDGERVLGCACGEGWAAVMTSRRFLRLFTSGGNQGQVLWLAGDPVTMVGRQRFLAVFYHESAPRQDKTQQLGYLLYDSVSNNVVSKGSVSCLSKGASLTWVGFSNDSSLLAMDSEGMLSMLVHASHVEAESAHWEWVPVLDTVGLRKSADDSYWPVTVYDGKLVCVPLKGGTKHPDATRKPVTSTLGFRLPLARGTLTKSNALEELSIRADMALKQKKVVHELTNEGDEEDADFEKEYYALSAQVDKVTLKMFAASVDAGKLERALDLVERLHLEKSFDLAMTIADSHRKLVDLVEEVKDRKFSQEEEEDDDDDDDEPMDTPVGTHLVSRRISPDASLGSKSKRPFHAMEAGVPLRTVRRK